MANCSSSSSSCWRKVALKGFLGALVGSVIVCAALVLRHKDPARGTF